MGGAYPELRTQETAVAVQSVLGNRFLVFDVSAWCTQVEAFEESQKYKEGKCIIEKAKMSSEPYALEA